MTRAERTLPLVDASDLSYVLRVQWPMDIRFFDGLELPAGYELDFLRAPDVASLQARLLQWYPDIAVGMESVHLSGSVLSACVHAQKSKFFGVVLRHVEDGVVSLLTLEKDVPSKTVWTRLGVLHPDHRRGSLGLLGVILLERAGRSMEAGLIHYYATLKSRHQQVIAERAGFSLVGIVPAHDIDMVEAGRAMRVYEAHYAKVLASDAEIEVPSRKQLSARTRRTFEQLFPETKLRP